MKEDIKISEHGIEVIDIKKKIFSHDEIEKTLILWEDIYSIEYDYNAISILLKDNHEPIQVETTEETNKDFDQIVSFRQNEKTKGNKFEIATIDTDESRKIVCEMGV